MRVTCSPVVVRFGRLGDTVLLQPLLRKLCDRKRASVSMPVAWKVTLKAHPGKIIRQELKQEAGGSGLRHAFSSWSSTVGRPASVIRFRRVRGPLSTQSSH